MSTVKLCTTTTLGTQKLWLLLTGGRYSGVLFMKIKNGTPKMVVAVDK